MKKPEHVDLTKSSASVIVIPSSDVGTPSPKKKQLIHPFNHSFQTVKWRISKYQEQIQKETWWKYLVPKNIKTKLFPFTKRCSVWNLYQRYFKRNASPHRCNWNTCAFRCQYECFIFYRHKKIGHYKNIPSDGCWEWKQTKAKFIISNS